MLSGAVEFDLFEVEALFFDCWAEQICNPIFLRHAANVTRALWQDKVMPKRQSGSSLMFVGAILLGIAISAVVMVVTGTRLDRDVSPDHASPEEVQRQELAAHTQMIADHGGDFAVFGEEWTNALGGVWVPWPDGAPEDYTNPPTPNPSFTDANEALVELSVSALSEIGRAHV